ncbi:Bardet-Biedl syndrome 1 ortholog [Strongyloides ratti]|uniref:Bardet-Biedl syndrome 1 ortholog n=1 Tax=Strongyloides ratti TaxID=34506 RepID=A0A090KSD7_STRRB|nr:Bardet-Biedl syndrome 1 ortholog [Strongyloides ratti]CEF60311.1 Bardet-Biedl syndrome 1 ortholog [Strongyloides ratti]
MSLKWVGALWDPSAKISTRASLVVLSDVLGDGDYKLLLVDMSQNLPKLKMFKGINPVAESALTSHPTGLVSFYNSMTNPPTPCIGLSTGNSVLIYRSLKPFYKFTLPSQEINSIEEALWNGIREKNITVEQFIEGIERLRETIPFDELTPQTQKLYLLDDIEDKRLYAESQVKNPLTFHSIITCLQTIKQNGTDDTDIDVLIIGTEHKQIIFVDTQAFIVLKIITIPGTPARIQCDGGYDIDCKLFILTRDNEVYCLKKVGAIFSCKLMINLKKTCSWFIKDKNKLAFSTIDDIIHIYSLKGKYLYEIKPEAPIINIEPFYYQSKQYWGILVAVKGEVRLYIENVVVDRMKIDSDISWIKYGKMGRENGVLTIVTRNGGLMVKIFRRTATLDEIGGIKLQSTPIQKIVIPKKTKAFVNQSLRERENPIQMHKIYQRDLFMLKHYITKSYAELQGSHLGSETYTKESNNVEMNVEVNGFGPEFRLIINITSTKKTIIKNLAIIILGNNEEYAIQNCIIPICSLVPNFTHSYTTLIKSIYQNTGSGSDIKILLVDANKNELFISGNKKQQNEEKNGTRPITTTVITMPVDEGDILD